VCVGGPQRKKEADEVTRDARTVFVSSLVVRATEQDVRDYFEAVGKVNDVQLIKDRAGKSKGFGYVEFASLDSVPQALVLNGQNFCMKHKGCVCSGLPVVVKPSEAEKNYEAAALSSVAQLSSRVYVGNLPGDAHQAELREIFKAAGEVTEVIFPRVDKDVPSYAFVQYKDQEAAQRAVHAFFGMHLRDHELKIGSMTSPGTAVAANGESWEVMSTWFGGCDFLRGSPLLFTRCNFCLRAQRRV
jgi:RNA-binding protein 23/39